MIKKVRHLMRMAAMLWLAVGVWKICVFVNPFVYKLWHLAPFPWESESWTKHYGNYVCPWFFTFFVIIAIVAISYILNRFTKWFFGDK